MSPKKRALLLGASGLTGGHLLQFLLADERYDRVTAVGRKSINIEHPKLQQAVLDFEQLNGRQKLFQAEDVFCCLGTTIKKAGSRENFIKVDHTYPLAAARLAKAAGAERFLIITSLGAHPKSPNFYLRTKGALEEELKALDFERLIIVRPSLLLGERPERRWAESLASKIVPAMNFLLIGPLRKYRAIEARKVAWCMAHLADTADEPVRIVESDELENLFQKNN